MPARPDRNAGVQQASSKRHRRADAGERYDDLKSALHQFNKTQDEAPYHMHFRSTPSVEVLHRSHNFVHTRFKSEAERERQWTLAYRRRRSLMQRGFFTPAGVGYRPIGDYIRMPFDLFQECIGFNIVSAHPP